MRTKNFDPNKEFARFERYCRNGLDPSTTFYLPINRPPFYKRRVAELFASYKVFPIGVGVQRAFPQLGRCIDFIPFSRSLLGRYEKITPQEAREYFDKMINEKAPKQRRSEH